MVRDIILFSVLFALFLSCKKDEIDLNYINPEISFHHSINGNPVNFNQFIYSNAYGNNYELLTMRYFISEIELITIEDDIINFEDVIYIDAADPAYLKTTLNKKIPNKTYSQLRFTFGIPPAQNKTGLFNNFPQAAMEWPETMGGGYHYMKLEGKSKNSTDTMNFHLHTGALNNNYHYFKVALPFNYQTEGNTFEIALNMEINNWFKSPHIINLEDLNGGMMGNLEMQKKIKENGADIFTIID